MHFLLWAKWYHESTSFDTFKSSDENLPIFSCHFPNHKSVFLQILHDSSVSWKITPLYFLGQNVIYFARKEPIKVKILETFECSDQNSPNSCHFWNNKSVFLQFVPHSSVSSDITPLYFLAEILYAFKKRSLSKYKIGEISPEKSKVWNFAFWLATFVKIE